MFVVLSMSRRASRVVDDKDGGVRIRAPHVHEELAEMDKVETLIDRAMAAYSCGDTHALYAEFLDPNYKTAEFYKLDMGKLGRYVSRKEESKPNSYVPAPGPGPEIAEVLRTRYETVFQSKKVLMSVEVAILADGTYRIKDLTIHYDYFNNR